MNSRIYQIIILKHALKIYKDTGMKVNEAYTPTAMLRTAEKLTGKTFKRRQYQEAINALEEMIDLTTDLTTEDTK